MWHLCSKKKNASLLKNYIPVSVLLVKSKIYERIIGICNFAVDTTTYTSDESLENVLKSLEKNSMLLYVGLKIIMWNWTQINVVW